MQDYRRARRGASAVARIRKEIWLISAWCLTISRIPGSVLYSPFSRLIASQECGRAPGLAPRGRRRGSSAATPPKVGRPAGAAVFSNQPHSQPSLASLTIVSIGLNPWSNTFWGSCVIFISDHAAFLPRHVCPNAHPGGYRSPHRARCRLPPRPPRDRASWLRSAKRRFPQR
jgi:hypothetical protein